MYFNDDNIDTNIDEEFEIDNKNLKDLIVYMKLHKTN